MSLTLITRDHRDRRQSVTVGGEYDRGVRGYVLLVVRPARQQMRPVDARRLARTLVRFADTARRPQ